MDDNFKKIFVVKVVREPISDPNLGIIQRRGGDKHQTYFLTIYENVIGNVTEKYIHATLRKYYVEYNILNIVAILYRGNGNYEMLTYVPFEDQVVCLPPNTYLQTDLYFEKVNDFMGTPLRVSLFAEEVRAVLNPLENFGTDYLIAELLAKRLNATLIVEQPQDNEEYGNPTSKDNATGSLGQVVREEVHIALNSRFLRLDLFYNNNIVEPTVSIGRDDMCVLVPKAAYTPMIYNLYHSLDISVWILILIVTFPFAGLFHCMATWKKILKLNGHRYNRPTLLDIFGTLFNQSHPQMPKLDPLRFLIIFWIMYCLLITNLLQSCLISSLAVKRHYEDVHFIGDLSNSRYTIIASTDYARLIQRYFNQSGSNQERLTNKLWPMSWAEYNKFINVSNTDYAYANKYHITSYYAKIKLNNGLPLYNAMRECLVPFLACYIVPFGSPILNRFNDIISWTNQAGIFAYWERSTNENPKSMSQQITTDEETHKPLLFDAMSAFFYLWICGLTLSIIVFVVEIWKHRKISNNLK